MKITKWNKFVCWVKYEVPDFLGSDKLALSLQALVLIAVLLNLYIVLR